MYDIISGVPEVLPLIWQKYSNTEKCSVAIICKALTPSNFKELVSTTEPLSVVGEPNRWFAVALQIPEDASEVVVSLVITTDGKGFHPIVSVKIDLPTLLNSSRLLVEIAPKVDLKLAVCPRGAMSPLESRTILNPYYATYAYPQRNTILRELCGEVKFGYSSTIDFLTIRIDQIRSEIEKYSLLLRRARIVQGLFHTNDEATSNLWFPCSIRVVAIQSLVQSQRVSGSKTLSSPFVAVSIKSKRGNSEPVVKYVGRTNTEYRTADPVFGSNENLNLAEHSSPVKENQPGRYGRITSDGAWLETYIREGDVLQFSVYHERHSVYQGVTHHLMCSAETTFEDIVKAGRTTREIQLQGDNPQRLAGTLIAVTMLTEMPSTNPFDRLTDDIDLLSLDEKTSNNLSKIPTYWLGEIIAKMKSNLDGLSLMLQETQQRSQASNGTTFKSSKDKRNFALGAITTNLHQCEFSIASMQAPFETIGRFAYTTCGVPSAICLGVNNLNASLYMRNIQLGEELRSLGRSFSDGFDLSTAVNNTSLLDPGIESPFQQCPLYPPCSKPLLNVDDTCGSPFHKRERTSSTSTARSSRIAASTVRSAAASIASKFTVSSESTTASPAPVTSSNKQWPKFSRWQSVVNLQFEVFYRETVAVSQALAPTASVLVSEILLSLNRGPADAKSFGAQLKKSGFLIGWESLISTHGAEMCMLADVDGVVDFLNRNCSIVCRSIPSSSRDLEWTIRIEQKSNSSISIVLHTPAYDFKQLFPDDDTDKDVEFSLQIVLFTQGVNETQSFSNLLNKEFAAKQAEINKVSIQRLVNYALRIDTNLPDPLRHLNALVQNQRVSEKEVDILLLAEDSIRALRGGRQVMCKSGKDRTAMAVTLEQSRLATNVAVTRDLANLMREFGVRIQVAQKNVGAKLYSFNMIQRMTLPSDYRPPVSVIQDLATSYAKKDS